MSLDDSVVAALAQLAKDDVAELLDDVRREGRALARRHLVEAYADALVRAVGQGGDEPASADASRLRPPTPPSNATGCYLYAVMTGGGTGAPVGATGVQPGGPVDVVVDGDLAAVVSDVDVEALRRGCDEADVGEGGWLANAVRAHEWVVVQAFRSAPTIPIRFGVVQPHRDAVAQTLRDNASRLHAEIARLEGTAEWNVRMLADPAAIERTLAADEPEEVALTDGRGFLLRERARRDLGAKVRAVVRDRAAELAAALEPLALDRVDRRRSSTTGGEAVLSATYLFRRADENALRAAVRQVAERAGAGVEVSADGPWPPFHFTSLRLDGADA